MDLTLRLNARLHPIHQFQFEDVIHTLLTKKGIGETSGGGVAQDPEGETTYCEIEIHLDDTKPNNIIQLLEILSKTGIPKGSTLWSADPEFNMKSVHWKDLLIISTIQNSPIPFTRLVM